MLRSSAICLHQAEPKHERRCSNPARGSARDGTGKPRALNGVHLAGAPLAPYIGGMCGRVVQSSGLLRYAIVDGLDVRHNRLSNLPHRWNAAPSQELLVIRRNPRTGERSLDPLRWGLIPHWYTDPT